MKQYLLGLLYISICLCAGVTNAENRQMSIPMRDAQEVIDAQRNAHDYVYFGRELVLDELAGQKVMPLGDLINRIRELAPEEKFAAALESLATRITSGSVVAPKNLAIDAVETARSVLVSYNDRVNSDTELRDLSSQLEFYKTALEQDALTIEVSQERAPRPPLDTGDLSATGNVGDQYDVTTVCPCGAVGGGAGANAFVNGGNNFGAPSSTLGNQDNFPLNIITDNTIRLTIADSAGAGAVTVLVPLYADGGIDRSTAATTLNIGATNANIVTVGSIAQTTAVDLPYGYVTSGSSRYIHKTGSLNFFAGIDAGNLSISGAGNTGIGNLAIASIGSGASNTAMGQLALNKLDSGNYNTAVGRNAGDNLVSGSRNILIGYTAGTQYNGAETDNICIGNGGVVGDGTTGPLVPSAIRIGRTSFNATCYIAGIRGVTLTNQAQLVGVDATNTQLGTTDAAGFTLGGTLTTSSAIYADGGIDRSTAATTLNIGTTNANIVTVGSVAQTTAVNLPYGYVTTVGNRYIHKTGTNNFFAGVNAGNTSTSGTGENTGIGNLALSAITNGTNNTALGSSALTVATSNLENTAVGCNALTAASFTSGTDGSYNTAIGCNAGYRLTTGSSNILLGRLAGSAYGSNESSNICIGHSGVSGVDNNTIRIGTHGGAAGQQNTCYIAGIVGNTGGAFTDTVMIDPFTNQLGVLPSSRRYKENITSLDSQDRFMHLNPVTFNYKTDTTKTPQFGLIAEEVEPVYPELVVYDKDGQVESVKYHLLDAILIKEIQTLRARIQALEAKIA